ncbi:MAG: type II toxin-antitoxin system HicA family toxin [Anaerolineales bacterium]|nr:type II toxin-antitoxin system HicA family toxin [Anaerolineales bacterium]
MGKLRILSGREVCDILMRNGFVMVRQKGSHIIMQKLLPDTTITVPVPNHTELRIGTLQSCIAGSRRGRSLSRRGCSERGFAACHAALENTGS